MLKLLLKKQLAEIFRNYFYDPKKNRARSKAGTAGYILLFLLLAEHTQTGGGKVLPRVSVAGHQKPEPPG